MRIFNHIALQGLKKNRTQTLVTIIGVILSAAMMTAVATFGTSLLHFLIQGSMAKCGDWQVAFFDADTAFIQAQAEDQARRRRTGAQSARSTLTTRPRMTDSSPGMGA